jgi:hypothetical protein
MQCFLTETGDIFLPFVSTFRGKTIQRKRCLLKRWRVNGATMQNKMKKNFILKILSREGIPT